MDASVAAVPLLPGAASELERIAQLIAESRLEEHRMSRRGLGIRRERWWTDEAKGIGFLMLEGPGVSRAGVAFSAPASNYDAWYQSRIAAAVPADADWYRAFAIEPVFMPATSYEPLRQSTVLAFPLEPGCTDSWRTLGDQALGVHRESFEDFHARLGLQQMWWLLREPEGDIALMYMESDDVVGAITTLADSQHVVDLWLRQKYLEILGVDWRAGIPNRMSRLVFDWADEPARRVIELDRRSLTLPLPPERAR